MTVLRSKRTLIFAGLGMLSFGCREDAITSSSGSSQDMASVDFEAAASEDDQESLALADNTVVPTMSSFKMSVSCKGIDAFEVTTVPFNIPIGASNCLAKLKSMKVGDKNYIEPEGGSGLTHFLVNDRGQFVNEAYAQDKLYVRVKKQLPSTISASASVEYEFSNIVKFDTIDGSRGETPSSMVSSGTSAPPLKVVAAVRRVDVLNVKLSCADPKGFVNSTLDTMMCGSFAIKDLKVALMPTTEDKASASTLTSLQSKLVSVKELPNVLGAENNLVIGFKNPVESPYYLFSAANGQSYTYGFIKMGFTNTVQSQPCAAQGDQPNFIKVSTNTTTGIGQWRDTSNCNVWIRPSLAEKVRRNDRFKYCGTAVKDGVTQKWYLPYGSEIKAAYDRKMKDLAFGPAPKLGEPTTFWLVGGRVFNMADGSIRAAAANEDLGAHSILCFLKKNK